MYDTVNSRSQTGRALASSFPQGGGIQRSTSLLTPSPLTSRGNGDGRQHCSAELLPDEVQRAIRGISKDGKFLYTIRNLYYRLIRDDVWPEPVHDAVESLAEFEEAVSDYERRYGMLDSVIRASDLPPEPDMSHLHSDIIDYTVRRVIVFDRPEPFLLFALNGFHRKIEIGLALWPDYPRHIWNMHEWAPAEAAARTFYVMHDCTPGGYALADDVRAFVAERQLSDTVVDVGMRFVQAANLGLTVRRENSAHADPAALVPEEADDRDEALVMLQAGGFVHLEELSPLQMMRWGYRRIAKRHQDVGFG